VGLHLPIADVTVNPLWVILLGAAVGFLSGLFGVGGGFLVTPMLNIAFGVPYDVAAGSSLAQILGTSVSATAKHHGLGNVDVRLGVCTLAGGWIGVECGARVVELLKRAEPIVAAGRELPPLDLFVPIVFLLLLSTVGTVTFRESRGARKREPRGGIVETRIASWIQSIRIPPTISLTKSGIQSISLCIFLGVGFATGFLSGLLGIGSGFVLMPTLIYVIRVPTTVAIGTGLFQMIFLAFLGTLTHTLKGNVDLVLVVLLLLGSIFGAQFGASFTGRVRPAKIRYWFSLIIYGAAAAVLVKLLVLLGLLGAGSS
jgi:uncharacterized membrane protein YfcA